MLQSSECSWGVPRSHWIAWRGKRCARKGQLPGQPELCPATLRALPLPPEGFLHFTRPKSASLENPLTDLLTSWKIPAPELPNPWDLACSWLELESLLQGWGPAVPHCQRQPLVRLSWTKRQLCAPYSSRKRLDLLSFLWGELHSRMQGGIRGSSDWVCWGLKALELHDPAHSSADAHTALLLLLPRLARSCKTNSCFSGYCCSFLPFRYSKRFLYWFRWERIKLEKTNSNNTILYTWMWDKSLLLLWKQKNVATWPILKSPSIPRNQFFNLGTA